MKQALAVLKSLIITTLTIAGIAGLGLQAFRDGGWLVQGLEKVTAVLMNFSLIALGLVIALFLGYRAWRSATSGLDSEKLFDLLMYLFIAAGIYYIARYVIKDKL